MLKKQQIKTYARVSLFMHLCHFYLHREQNLCTYVTDNSIKFHLKVDGVWVGEHRSGCSLKCIPIFLNVSRASEIIDKERKRKLEED